MGKVIFGLLVGLMLLGSIMLVHSAAPPSIFGVYAVTEYAVDCVGSEKWGHAVLLHVTDPDGLDNLIVDGKISIRIIAPDGYEYPLPTDELVVTMFPEADPPEISIAWYSQRLSHPPVLGSYEIIVTDRDGLSTSYVTQPTVRVSDRVPTIIYPPNYGVVADTYPTFVWEAFSPEAVYFLEIVHYGETIWRSPHLMADQLSYKYDGPELVRGENYGFYLFVFEDEIVGESEIRRVTSLRGVSFTLAPWAAVGMVDVQPQTLNLASSGKWITAYIELPEGYDVNEINVSSILLNETIPAESMPTAIGDYDSDGIPDLMVKFDRTQLQSYIYHVLGIKYGLVTLKITGQLFDGTPFEGFDTIQVNYAGDANNDGTINIGDVGLVLVSAHWYPGPPIGPLGYDSNADFNNDGAVNIGDIGILSVNWGQAVP